MKNSLGAYFRLSSALKIKALLPHTLTPITYAYYSTHHYPKIYLEPAESKFLEFFNSYDKNLSPSEFSQFNRNCIQTHIRKEEIKPLAIVGPSGVGKSTLINKMIEDFPNSFEFSVSSTTRKPRKGEIDGVNYHFLAREEFMAQVKKGEFVEWAEVHNNLYGTSKTAIRNIQEKGKICIMDIDVQGIKTISDSDIQINAIFILPKSTDQLRNRLMSRGQDSIESINTRVRNAENEMQFAEKNKELFDSFIVNDDVEIASSEMAQNISELYRNRRIFNLA